MNGSDRISSTDRYGETQHADLMCANLACLWRLKAHALTETRNFRAHFEIQTKFDSNFESQKF